MFKKYNSIENDYNVKFITKMLEKYPELKHKKYIVTEKIHGSNFQININGDTVRYGKRTSLLNPDESFFNYQEAVEQEKIQNYITIVKDFMTKQGIEHMIVYGELYGANIQKEVYYKSTRDLIFFDIYNVDEERYLSFKEIKDNGLYIKDLYVPIIAITDTLDEALQINPTFITIAGENKEDNYAEGVVIKPYDIDIMDPSRFIIKHKNERFKEKKKVKKVKPTINLSEYTDILTTLESLITVNRLNNLISKEGEIEPKTIGKFIKLYMADVVDDLMKEHLNFNDLDKKIKKQILSKVNKDVAIMIKNSAFGVY